MALVKLGVVTGVVHIDDVNRYAEKFEARTDDRLCLEAKEK
jgi:hypothetical protein